MPRRLASEVDKCSESLLGSSILGTHCGTGGAGRGGEGRGKTSELEAVGPDASDVYVNVTPTKLAVF